VNKPVVGDAALDRMVVKSSSMTSTSNRLSDRSDEINKRISDPSNEVVTEFSGATNQSAAVDLDMTSKQSPTVFD